jgi:hypothetical protein
VIVPSAARHVTALFVVVPPTLAANVSVPPVADDAVAGDTVTDVTVGAGAAVTVTLDVSDLLPSATLVAVTVSVPAFAGAVYTPPAVIVPSNARHVTALSVVVPATVAANVSLPLTATVTAPGVTVTDVTVGVGAGAAVTVTLDVSDWLGSATLVAVTLSTPALAGAVYCPAAVIVPNNAFHVTALFVVVPATVAKNVTFPLATTAVVAGVTVTDVTLAVGGGFVGAVVTVIVARP